ncbi:hypothetical protein DIPPA_13403 [Diplonema papillatum]|nr:hypothetical protein DIPPA_13403 [Diplonema papillatum]
MMRDDVWTRCVCSVERVETDNGHELGRDAGGYYVGAFHEDGVTRVGVTGVILALGRADESCTSALILCPSVLFSSSTPHVDHVSVNRRPCEATMITTFATPLPDNHLAVDQHTANVPPHVAATSPTAASTATPPHASHLPVNQRLCAATSPATFTSAPLHVNDPSVTNSRATFAHVKDLSVNQRPCAATRPATFTTTPLHVNDPSVTTSPATFASQHVKDLSVNRRPCTAASATASAAPTQADPRGTPARRWPVRDRKPDGSDVFDPASRLWPLWSAAGPHDDALGTPGVKVSSGGGPEVSGWALVHVRARGRLFDAGACEAPVELLPRHDTVRAVSWSDIEEGALWPGLKVPCSATMVSAPYNAVTTVIGVATETVDLPAFNTGAKPAPLSVERDCAKAPAANSSSLQLDMQQQSAMTDRTRDCAAASSMQQQSVTTDCTRDCAAVGRKGDGHSPASPGCLHVHPGSHGGVLVVTPEAAAGSRAVAAPPAVFVGVPLPPLRSDASGRVDAVVPLRGLLGRGLETAAGPLCADLRARLAGRSSPEEDLMLASNIHERQVAPAHESKIFSPGAAREENKCKREEAAQTTRPAETTAKRFPTFPCPSKPAPPTTSSPGGAAACNRNRAPRPAAPGNHVTSDPGRWRPAAASVCRVFGGSSWGSGVSMGGGWFLTNRHVVIGDYARYAALAVDVTRTDPAGGATTERWPAECVYSAGGSCDLAAIRVQGPPSGAMPPCPVDAAAACGVDCGVAPDGALLGPHPEPAAAQRVVVVGYPKSTGGPVVSFGTAMSRAGGDVLIVTGADVSPGCSGGGVFSCATGELIGICTSCLWDATLGATVPSIGVCIPIRQLRPAFRLVAECGDARELLVARLRGVYSASDAVVESVYALAEPANRTTTSLRYLHARLAEARSASGPAASRPVPGTLPRGYPGAALLGYMLSSARAKL